MEGYRDGKLIEAWRNGDMLILDELPKMDPNTAGLLNEALAETDKEEAVIQSPKGEKVQKHPDFSVVATGNVYPNNEDIAYAANNKQDLSLLDRFSGCIYYIEENWDLEKLLLENNMLIWSLGNKLREIIKSAKYEAQMSLRWMLSALKVYKLEMQREKDKSKNLSSSEGKNLKDMVDSYLSTFDNVQQNNLKKEINYANIIYGYQYRKLNSSQEIKF